MRGVDKLCFICVQVLYRNYQGWIHLRMQPFTTKPSSTPSPIDREHNQTYSANFYARQGLATNVLSQTHLGNAKSLKCHFLFAVTEVKPLNCKLHQLIGEAMSERITNWWGRESMSLICLNASSTDEELFLTNAAKIV